MSGKDIKAIPQFHYITMNIETCYLVFSLNVVAQRLFGFHWTKKDIIKSPKWMET